MNYVQTPTQSFSVTSATYGTLTLVAGVNSDTSDLYRGLVGWLNSSSGTPGPVKILLKQVNQTTGLVQAVLADHTNNGHIDGTASNLSAYAGGHVFFENQIAEVQTSKTIATGLPI